ncbi:glutamate receptor ionotropic, kainate 4-like [Gigantopelta aegis]|uniref:glutamate receptor ionotropic, kainate 4-like n=1 Tax=Gigantopelta aegis TaxID=1735272 RepID=UPI001B88CC65|nr:glutamate receptor ionotropic, kainate 4-like [Gigantopelta aegis]
MIVVAFESGHAKNGFMFENCNLSHMDAYNKDHWVSRQSNLKTNITYQQEKVGIVSKACTCLVQRLAWEKIIILFDNPGELFVQDMLMYWSETQFQIPVQMTNVDSAHSNSSYRVFLHDLYHGVHRLNLILIARPTAVSAIIKDVNDFDLFSNRSTDFRHRSKWIVVSEESIKENLTTWAKDLENVAFISSLNMDDYFTSPVFRNGTVSYEGYGVDILNVMAKYLNFTYVITQPEDMQWGLLVNGTWNGIVGILVRREADLQISSLTVHEDRAMVLHFLQPPVHTQVVDVLYKRLDLYEDNLFTYIRQFKPMVFLCIGVSAAVFCLLFVISECSSEHSTESARTSGSCRRILLLLDRVAWFTVASAAQRSVSIKTRTTSGNILVASWSLFLIVMTAAYTANLVAELTSKKPRVPFRTLGELVDNNEFTFGLTSSSINKLIFEKTKHGDIKRAWTVIQRRASTDQNVLHDSDEYHLRRALSEKYAWITSRKVGRLRGKGNCSLVFMNSPFNWQHLAFAVPVGSSYINEFEKTLSILNDNGVLVRLRKKWFKTLCDKEEYTSLESAKILKLSDVRGAFILSAVGIGLATMAVILEIVYTRTLAK